MSSFTRQKRPRSPDAIAVEGRAVLVLPVSVVVVAIPSRSVGKVYAQQRIDDPNRVQNSRIIRRAQPEAHQSQRVRTDDRYRWRVRGHTILDGNEALERRGCSVTIKRRDTDVIAIDSDLPSEVCACSVCPAFDVVVPSISHLAKNLRRLGLSNRLGEIGGNEQGRDFGRQREG